MPSSVKGLPGWKWIYKGEETWRYTDKKGVDHYTDERHARNILTGQILSVGAAQRAVRKAEAEEAPVVIPESTKTNVEYPQLVETLHGGRKAVIVAASLEELQTAVQQQHIINRFDWATAGYISVYYANKNDLEGGTDTALQTNGYATLTGYYLKQTLEERNYPWERAVDKEEFYEYDKNSRFILTLTER